VTRGGRGADRGERRLTALTAAVVLGAAAFAPWLVHDEVTDAGIAAGQAAAGTPASPTSSTAPTGSTTPTTSRAPTASTSPLPSASSSRPAPPRPTFEPVKVAAADRRNRIDGAKTTECAPCASGSRVQYLGQGHTLVVPLKDVAVAGKRRLTIVYQSDGLRRLFVGVGDAEPLVLELSGAGDWETPARVTVTVFVPKGDVDLKFYNTNEPAPDLDQIILR
jgi:hypothetical protein